MHRPVADANARDGLGKTALIHAIRNDNGRLLQVLFGDVDFPVGGKKPLRAALRGGLQHSAPALLELLMLNERAELVPLLR